MSTSTIAGRRGRLPAPETVAATARGDEDYDHQEDEEQWRDHVSESTEEQKKQKY